MGPNPLIMQTLRRDRERRLDQDLTRLHQLDPEGVTFQKNRAGRGSRDPRRWLPALRARPIRPLIGTHGAPRNAGEAPPGVPGRTATSGRPAAPTP